MYNGPEEDYLREEYWEMIEDMWGEFLAMSSES